MSENMNQNDYEEYQEFLKFKEMKRKQNQSQQPMGMTKYCKYCGSVIDANAKVCPVCGQQLGMMSQNNTTAPNSVGQGVVSLGKYEVYAWLLAFVPLLDLLLYPLFGYLFGEIGVAIAILICELIVWKVDKDTLEALGIETNPWAYWIFVCTPVYLFMRASRTNKNWAPGIISSVLFVISLIGVITHL